MYDKNPANRSVKSSDEDDASLLLSFAGVFIA